MNSCPSQIPYRAPCNLRAFRSFMMLLSLPPWALHSSTQRKMCSSIHGATVLGFFKQPRGKLAHRCTTRKSNSLYLQHVTNTGSQWSNKESLTPGFIYIYISVCVSIAFLVLDVANRPSHTIYLHRAWPSHRPGSQCPRWLNSSYGPSLQCLTEPFRNAFSKGYWALGLQAWRGNQKK